MSEESKLPQNAIQRGTRLKKDDYRLRERRVGCYKLTTPVQFKTIPSARWRIWAWPARTPSAVTRQRPAPPIRIFWASGKMQILISPS